VCVCVCVCVRARATQILFECMCICVCVRREFCLGVCVHVLCVHVLCVCVCVCVCVYMCVFDVSFVCVYASAVYVCCVNVCAFVCCLEGGECVKDMRKSKKRGSFHFQDFDVQPSMGRRVHILCLVFAKCPCRPQCLHCRLPFFFFGY